MPASEAGIPKTSTATSTSVAAPAMAHQCGFTRNPASRPNSTRIGRAATRVEKTQLCSGSYTWVHFMAQSPGFTRSFDLSEFRNVIRQLFARGRSVLALHHRANLLHDIRVGEGRHVADIPAIRDRREHPAHDLPGPRLGHGRDDIHVLGPRDLPDDFFVRLDHTVDDFLARLHARLDRDVDFRHASLYLVLDRHDSG